MAPIRKREMSIEYDGAKRMWQMLLEKVMPGKKKYILLPTVPCRGLQWI